MNFVALKMLLGDRARYMGILVGISFASLLITQQASIFVGIMTRTFSFLTDVNYPQIWVMDPKVQYVDDIKPLQDTQLYRVRSVPGVAWATPLYKGLLKARLSNGNFQTCIVIGLDDATLVGGPATMVAGQLTDLRRDSGIIVDLESATGRLARVGPDGRRIPLAIGDSLEINDRRAIVVGICQVTRTFQSQPVIYTTYTRATLFAPRERKLLSFVVAGVAPGHSPRDVCRDITARTGLAAYTTDEFKALTVRYFLKYTGIPVNFGTSVLLGFIVGIAIAGQTFHNFTLDNLRYFGTLKAMGAGNRTLLRMILLQALLVGALGYGLGVGAAATWGHLMRDTPIAFRMPWQLLLLSGVAVLLICLLSAALSIRKVMKLEPAIVFR